MPRIAVVARPGNLSRFVAPTIASLVGRAEVVVVAGDPGYDRWASLPGVRAEKMIPSTSPLNQGPRALRSYLHWVRLGKHDWRNLEKYVAWFPKHRRPLMQKLHRSRLTKLAAWSPLAGRLRKMEAAEPPVEKIVNHLKKLAPDFVLVIPVVFQNHADVDYLKAAKHLSIPVAAVIPSWDNLTTKGIFHIHPDYVFVWNAIQKNECTRYHGLQEKTVIPCGAPAFDGVYERRGLIPRDEFFRQAKLDPAKPFVLWAASSMGGRDESSIVKTLAQDLPPDAQILVRPHPKYSNVWKEEDFAGMNVSIWSGSRFAEDEQSAGEIVSSVEYTSAVLGLSTSMFLEAAVLDRPTALIHKPLHATEWHSLYLHFEYLLQSKFVEICDDEKAMGRWVSRVLAGGDGKSAERKAFATSFLRPVEPNRPAAEVMAEKILALASIEPAPAS